MAQRQIWILEDNEKVREILQMHIESEFNAEMLMIESVERALSSLSNTNFIPPALIIANYRFQGDHSSRLYAALKDRNLKIPFILLTEKYPSTDQHLTGFLIDKKLNSYLKYPVKEHDLVTRISEVFKIERPSKIEGYRRVRGQYIQLFREANYPIFMIDHENKYIEVTQVDHNSSTNDFYFIALKDYVDWSAKVNEDLVKKLRVSSLPLGEKISLQFDSVKKIHSALEGLGLSRDEILLGEAVFSSSLNILSKNPRMSSLLGRMIRQDGYASGLAMMCHYLSLAIASRTPWYSDHTAKKLAMSAIIQDLVLQNDELCKICDLNSDPFKQLSEKDQKKVLTHPEDAVKLVMDLADTGDLANNIRDIVLCHHERPHGGGFPRKLEMENLSGLSCIFILAHEFSHRLLEKKLEIETLKKIQVDFERD